MDSIFSHGPLNRSNLAELAAFVAIGEVLSFRAAGARLGISSSALSHAITQLEKRLGVRLLHRTTRSVALTDQGRRLLDRVRPALTELQGALADLDEERALPAGRLRLRITAGSAAAVIAPIWGRFLAAYPDVQLELEMGNAPVDIVAAGFDAAVGLRAMAAADMVAVRVTGPFKMVVVGAPAYFARRAPPVTPADLAAHDCIQYRWNDAIVPWPFYDERGHRRLPLRGAVTVNSTDLAARAAVDGLGLGCIDETIARSFLQSGQLIQILDRWSPSYDGYFLYYPGHRNVPSPLRALIDVLCEERGAKRKSVSLSEDLGDG